ncbi:MAG: hypothetical protein ACYSRQ_02620 [Planctomycetota bacterium]|jgi:hypothetical protein
MKKLFIISIIAVMALSTITWAKPGHGAPKGHHYTLNLLGKAWDDKDPIDNCGNGHRIFVNLGESVKNSKGKGGKSSLNSITEILLIQNFDDEFDVLDCDGTDGEAAFTLPDPNDPSSDCTRYSVWARALGKPGGSASMNTCATYTDPTGLVWIGCSNEMVDLTRKKGQAKKTATNEGKPGTQKFVDVSKELLTICVPVCVDYNDIDQTCEEVVWERRYIFDDELEDEYWKYNNSGLRHAQLRFYWEPSCPDFDDDWSCDQLGVPPEWQ